MSADDPTHDPTIPSTESPEGAPAMTDPRTPLRLVVLTAGLSTPSSTRMLADQLSRAVARRAESAGRPVETSVVELREIAHDVTDALLTRFPNERLAMVVESLRAADAVIAVTPVFNVGPSGLFKSFVDATDPELWRDKPVLLAATAGTPRHSLALDYALRPMFGYLKAELAPTAVFAASADFGAAAAGEGEEHPLAERVDRAARELLVLVTGRAGSSDDSAPTGGDGTAPSPAPRDEFADFVPMDRLLRR